MQNKHTESEKCRGSGKKKSYEVEEELRETKCENGWTVAAVFEDGERGSLNKEWRQILETENNHHSQQGNEELSPIIKCN